MEASASEQINPGLLLWNNDHRSPTADEYFFPHEVRSLVKRQKIIEVIISLLLGVVYILVMAGSGLSFYFFHDAQKNYTHDPGWFLSYKCVLYNATTNKNISYMYPCTVVYVSQIVAALGAVFLLIGSLVKSCRCMW